MSENTLELTPEEIGAMKELKNREAVLEHLYRVAMDDLERRLDAIRKDSQKWWADALNARGLKGNFGCDINDARPMLRPLLSPEEQQQAIMDAMKASPQ